ncbi:MAG: hypothetical protein JNM88_15370 [Chitinophagaceae bacterium]|nr:hypothetical protein [Chitinophagaceae bacterium]
MKNVFIGLLIIAAGAGVYFFILKKKKPGDETVSINKELIIGKWQLAAAEPLKDSALLKYSYDFQPGNIAMVMKADSAKTDTARYEWNKANELVMKENNSDTANHVFAVLKLTKDSLQLRGISDSMKVLLIKTR